MALDEGEQNEERVALAQSALTEIEKEFVSPDEDTLRKEVSNVREKTLVRTRTRLRNIVARMVGYKDVGQKVCA